MRYAILQKNLNKISLFLLSSNKYDIRILEQNLDKVSW